MTKITVLLFTLLFFAYPPFAHSESKLEEETLFQYKIEKIVIGKSLYDNVQYKVININDTLFLCTPLHTYLERQYPKQAELDAMMALIVEAVTIKQKLLVKTSLKMPFRTYRSMVLLELEEATIDGEKINIEEIRERVQKLAKEKMIDV